MARKKEPEIRTLTFRADAEMYKWLSSQIAKTSGREIKATRSSLIREAILISMDGPWKKITYSHDPVKFLLIPEGEDPVEILSKAIKIIELMKG